VNQDGATVSDLQIGPLTADDIPEIVAAFAAIGWNKPATQYERYLEEQTRGERDVFVAHYADAFAGYLTVVWASPYLPFREANIPEIQDLNVLPPRRRCVIASRLLDVAENRIAGRSPFAGIGVGMDADYGAAQRLYVKCGYVPDGHGLTYQRRSLAWGETVTVDDELVLYFTKSLGA
jgi:GNAT superfamily N-acetyltransferase